MIRFAHEPIVRDGGICLESRYPSDDGRWAVVEIWSHLAPRARGERVLLVRLLPAGEYIVSRCRSRREAIRTAREIDAQPVKRRRRRKLRDNT